jgi:regulator of sigma E protease
MSWVIAIAGFCALIVLHELGHFAAAKACGMRVERFSLFFPPKLASFRHGETEYALGSIPAGGYVKITGMSPDELRTIDLRIAHRTYYMQPPWKRIVVIVAGPAVNLLIAFALFAGVLWSGSLGGDTTISNLAPSVATLTVLPSVSGVLAHAPADGVLRAGDRIVTIDGRKASVQRVVTDVERDRCVGTVRAGCRAGRPVTLGVIRNGARRTLSVYPRYDSSYGAMKIGFDFSLGARHFGVLGALGTAGSAMWSISESTITHLYDAITSPKVRRQLHSVVGITEVTQQAVALGSSYAFVILGLVSLILGVMNLFPFLPLDGGHVVWSLAEKVRGRRVSLAAMWSVGSWSRWQWRSSSPPGRVRAARPPVCRSPSSATISSGRRARACACSASTRRARNTRVTTAMRTRTSRSPRRAPR